MRPALGSRAAGDAEAAAPSAREDEAGRRDAPVAAAHSGSEARRSPQVSLSALLLCSLVAYRLTLLATSDTITRRPRMAARAAARRRWPAREGDNPRMPLVLLNCGRCLGFWASGLTVVVLWALGMSLGGTPLPVAWLAVAGAVTLLVAAAP